MKQYYRYLNLPESAINDRAFFDNLSKPSYKTACANDFWPGYLTHDSLAFSNEFRRILEDRNCNIFKGETFRILPNRPLSWHSDTNDIIGAHDLDWHETTKINFMWGDVDNFFVEYGEVVDHAKPMAVTNLNKRQTNIYNPNTIKIIERFKMTKPIMINRGPIHRGVNYSNQDIITLSCIIYNNTTDNFLLFKDAINLFSDIFSN